MPTLSPRSRTAALSGFTTSIPIALSTFPFGLAYGVAAAASGLDPWLGASASWTVMAGAAQLSMLSLIERRASWVVVIAAAMVINLRFALYSIALAPAFKDFPPRWRFTLPYVMTDMAAVVSLQYFEQQSDPVARRWYYLTSSLTIASMWWAGTIAGIIFGNAIPPRIDVGFMVPLAFVVLIAPALTDRPSIAAAVAAGAASVIVTGLPSGLNTIAGAAAGVAAGALVDRLGR